MKGVLLLLILNSTLTWALSTEAIKKNNLGVSQFEKKNYYPAYQSFLQSLVFEPFSPKVHLNLGLTFQQNEEFDKAIQEYKLVTRLPDVDPESVFYAHFNAATVLAGQSQIPEALAEYQAALELQPDSKEVKTNIELLWQQQQGGGKGKGKNKDSKSDKNKDKNEKDKDQSQDQKPEEQKKPEKFESQKLSQDDVRKILDELKNQEQQIRAEMNKKETKEAPRAKNW